LNGQRWSTRLGFTFGAVGTAVGLGSIWRFPYLAGAGGGFAFIAVFVLACLIFGAPVLVGEILIGRWSRQSPPRAAGDIAQRFGFSRSWNIVGWSGSLAGFLIITYYSMIAGWVLAYAWFFLTGNYARGGVAPAVAKFEQFVADSREVTLWQAGFLLLVAVISARGLHRGVEFINRIRAPALLLLMLILAGYSLSAGDVARGLHFAFAPDLHRLTPAVLLGAVGQALYALGISCGVMIAYGAYMAPGESLRRNVLAVVGSIFTVSLLATVIIFPLVFRYGLNPAQGPELVFQVLPVAFAQMPAGRIVGTLFFALLVLAALTPSVGLLEVPVSWLSERSGLRRGSAALLTATVALALGQGSVQSYGHLAHWHPFAAIPPVAQLTVFGLADYMSANILMPLSALLVSVFVGWRMAAHVPDAELSGLSPFMRQLLMLALRYLCPLGITVVLLVGLWP